MIILHTKVTKEDLNKILSKAGIGSVRDGDGELIITPAKGGAYDALAALSIHAKSDDVIISLVTGHTLLGTPLSDSGQRMIDAAWGVITSHSSVYRDKIEALRVEIDGTLEKAVQELRTSVQQGFMEKYTKQKSNALEKA